MVLPRFFAGRGLRSKHLEVVSIVLRPSRVDAVAALPLTFQFCTRSIWQHVSNAELYGRGGFWKNPSAIYFGCSLATASVRYFVLTGSHSLKSRTKAGLELFLRKKKELLQTGLATSSWKYSIARHRGDLRLSTLMPYSGSGRFSNPKAVLWGLIGLNLAVYSLWYSGDFDFMHKHFMVSVDNLMIGRVHTLLTSAFSHKDFYHLLFNMLGLYFFGSEIAGSFGGRRLLLLYLAGGVAGSLGHVVYCCYVLPLLKGIPRSFYYSRYNLPALGASGAVNAIVVLDILLNPKRVILIDFLFPVPAILFGIYLVLKDLWGATKADSKTGHAGHLGGALVGVVAWMQLRRRWR